MLFGLGFREKEEQECGAVWLFTKPDFFFFYPLSCQSIFLDLFFPRFTLHHLICTLWITNQSTNRRKKKIDSILSNKNSQNWGIEIGSSFVNCVNEATLWDFSVSLSEFPVGPVVGAAVGVSLLLAIFGFFIWKRNSHGEIQLIFPLNFIIVCTHITWES